MVNLQNTKGGLIAYVQKGGRLPPREFIQDFQEKIYDFCHLENTEVIKDAKHYGKNIGETPAVMYFNKETRQIVLFNKTSGDLITAEKFRKNFFNRCVESRQIGNSGN